MGRAAAAGGELGDEREVPMPQTPRRTRHSGGPRPPLRTRCNISEGCNENSTASSPIWSRSACLKNSDRRAGRAAAKPGAPSMRLWLCSTAGKVRLRGRAGGVRGGWAWARKVARPSAGSRAGVFGARAPASGCHGGSALARVCEVYAHLSSWKPTTSGRRSMFAFSPSGWHGAGCRGLSSDQQLAELRAHPPRCRLAPPSDLSSVLELHVAGLLGSR